MVDSIDKKEEVSIQSSYRITLISFPYIDIFLFFVVPCDVEVIRHEFFLSLDEFCTPMTILISVLMTNRSTKGEPGSMIESMASIS